MNGSLCAPPQYLPRMSPNRSKFKLPSSLSWTTLIASKQWQNWFSANFLIVSYVHLSPASTGLVTHPGNSELIPASGPLLLPYPCSTLAPSCSLCFRCPPCRGTHLTTHYFFFMASINFQNNRQCLFSPFSVKMQFPEAGTLLIVYNILYPLLFTQ